MLPFFRALTHRIFRRNALEFLSLESTNSEYGQVSFLTVACFMIQHGRYSDPALIWMQSMLRAGLDEQTGQGAAPGMDDATQSLKFTRQADERPLPKIAWSMTIVDVNQSIQDPEKYIEHVKKWAQATLKQMDGLFPKSSPPNNDILSKFYLWLTGVLIQIYLWLANRPLYQRFTNTRFYQGFHEKSDVRHKRSILYMRMRQCIGIIGVALPLVLILGIMLLEDQSKILDSLSVYYYSDHTPYSIIGNMFVGGMFATGIFLICYQYRILDDIISTVAGLFAIGVALFPTTPPACNPEQQICPNPPAWIGIVHTVCAISFLVSLAFITLFLFPKSNMKNPNDRTDEKLWRNAVYYVCGFFMVIILVFAGLDLIVPNLNQVSWLQQIPPITWLEGFVSWQQQFHPNTLFEVLAVEFFGIAWFVKGETFGILKDKVASVLEVVQNHATRIVASTLGVLAGLLGVVHGTLELFQSNGVHGGIYIFAIGSPCQPNREWHSCFPAITIIPHYYWVTGVIAIIVSLLIIFWAAVFVQRKNGGLVLILLSIIQLLVGGGYISPILCFIAGLVGTMIQAPFTLWRDNSSFLWQSFLSKLWPWSWIFPIIALLLTGYVIHGYFFNGFMPILILFTIVIALVLLLLAVLTTVANDIQPQTNTNQAPSVAVEHPQP